MKLYLQLNVNLYIITKATAIMGVLEEQTKQHHQFEYFISSTSQIYWNWLVFAYNNQAISTKHVVKKAPKSAY